MPSGHATYPPLDTLKPVVDGLWIVDSGPMRPMGPLLPLPVRMTVIRLSSGGLLLHSPTRFAFPLKAELEREGPIRYLVAPNVAHWTFLKDWQDHLPGVTTWAAPGLRQRRQVRRSGVRLDRDLGDAAPEAWAAHIEQVVVPGIGGFAEVAMFHKPTRTLILTDLVQNLEPEKLPLAVRPAARLAGNTAPRGGTPRYMRPVVRLKGEAAREAGRRLVAFEPERVIFTHGQWYAEDGAAKLRRALAWLVR